MSDLLSDADRVRVNAAVAAAEAKTTAEIVPVIAAASGRYDRAEDLVGVWLGLGVMALEWSFWPDRIALPGSWGNPWNVWELLALITAFLAGFLAGTALASRYWWLRRPFVTRRQMREEVEAGARRAFFDRRVHHTAESTGLLIYISAFEHGAAVFGDQTVLDRLGEPTLRQLCDDLTASLKTMPLADALCRTIESAAERLAIALPAAGEPRNELTDAVVVLD
jgi:putative membrane protein